MLYTVENRDVCLIDWLLYMPPTVVAHYVHYTFETLLTIYIIICVIEVCTACLDFTKDTDITLHSAYMGH